MRDETGAPRLLDMIEGRSQAVFKTWLNQRDQAWRDGIDVIAMDGFTGFKTAAVEEVPQAVTVMDPFHVAHLAAVALDECRRRTQQDIFGPRGRAGDPLHRAGRSLRTGADLLTDRQKTRLRDLFAEARHTAVEVTWSVYQRTITAYRDPDRTPGKATMTALIDTIAAGVPSGLPEVARLGPHPAQPRRRRARTIRMTRHIQRPHGGHQRAPGPPARHHPGASATSPTTSPAASSKPAGSKATYTVDWEEPHCRSIASSKTTPANVHPSNSTCSTGPVITVSASNDSSST